MSSPKINRSAVTGATVLVARCTDGGANDGLPVEAACSSAGVLLCVATVDPAGLATSALQTSIGATAHTDSAAVLAQQVALLAAVTPFTTFVAIDYSGGNQTVSTSQGLTMRGFNITTAGALKVDCLGVTNGAYAVGLGTNLLAGVTKIYQTGSNAAGSIVY